MTKEDISINLYRFKPSDRATIKILSLQKEYSSLVIEAINEYLEIWDKSDWIDEYVIEILAKWCSSELDKNILDNIKIADKPASKIFQNNLRD